MRPGAQLLLIEAEALGAVLAVTPRAAYDNPTVCTGWSVRDVLAHCGAALTAAATGELHGFTPEDNERDVALRRGWPVLAVVEELLDGYVAAAAAVDAAGGRLDGIALGEWVHGGDVREALGADDPYASAGIELALGMLMERSERMGRPAVSVELGVVNLPFGSLVEGVFPASLETDLETFVRLCANRRPDPDRYVLSGAQPADFVLFS